MHLMKRTLPLITIGIVVLNRAWIIPKVLASIQSQIYPHNRLFILVVDGGSKDNTAKICEEILSKSDFNGYEIVIRKSNIPEGRNLCIAKMRGDFLLFWDSDVITKPSSVLRLLETLETEQVDVVTANIVSISSDSTDDIESKIDEIKARKDEDYGCATVKYATMGHTLISKQLLDKVIFDPDFTTLEDGDFSLRAREIGFKIIMNNEVFAYDVNVSKEPYSDVFGIDMPLRNALRGITKRTRVQVLWDPTVQKFSYFLKKRRHLLYLGYIPAVILSIFGVFARNVYFSMSFPFYFLLFLFILVAKKGVKRGIKSSVRSLLVGLPATVVLAYYIIKHNLKRL